MKYAVVYDGMFDELFQCEITDELAVKINNRPQAENVGIKIHDTLVEGIPIKSRYRSDRHPGWADEE